MSKSSAYDDQLYAHFVTFSCYGNRNLLDHDQAKRVVIGLLDSQRQIQKGRIVRFVIMPNHVHALIWFPQTGQLSQFMKQWKQRTSKIIRRELMPELDSYHAQMKNDSAFWQRKYHAFQVYSDQKLEEKLTYMHVNPVRAGLVERAVDWAWSSARHYEGQGDVGIQIEWPSS